ncbi:MAG: hypothetical protein LBT91_00520 [Bifidobacteriaceae bacterium]|jgi:uncharacterized protein YfbU (UPF0304 family)|nr:hypothetical protein [Bifidobacteriaceae bacterium]
MAQPQILANRFEVKRHKFKIDDFEINLGYDKLLEQDVFLYTTNRAVDSSLLQKAYRRNSDMILPVLSDFELDDKKFLYTTKAQLGTTLKRQYSKKALLEKPLSKNFINDFIFTIAKECQKVGRIEGYPLGINPETVLLDKIGDKITRITIIGQGLIVNKANFNPFGYSDLADQSRMCANDLVNLYNYLQISDLAIDSTQDVDKINAKKFGFDTKILSVDNLVNYLQSRDAKIIQYKANQSGFDENKADKNNLVKNNITKTAGVQKNKIPQETLEEKDFVKNNFEKDFVRDSFEKDDFAADFLPKKHSKSVILFIYLLLGAVVLATIGAILVLAGVIG